MKLTVTVALLWSVLSLTLVKSTIVEKVSDLPPTDFDFIIVGGGTAGNVIANRLTEDSKFQVLVLEAGPSNVGVLESEVPWLAANLFGSKYDWNLTTIPQEGLDGRIIGIPRGHILGGSSSINFMIYTRSAIEDFDRWASVTGDSGWSWDNLEPYFKKSERFTRPADNHNITGQFDPSVHGFQGPISTSLSGYPVPIDQMVLTASQQLGGDFEFNLDLNSGAPLGIGWIQTIVDGPTGTRSSSAAGYLAPKYITRPNLHVLVNAEVSRLLQSNGKAPAFRGVEFRQNPSGTLYQLKATKEIILCAGSIGSPHILLNSGIGDTDALKAVGITPLVHLPSVGANLTDHSVMAHPFIANSNDTFERIRDPKNVPAELELWKNTGTGPFVDTIASMVGFFRLPEGVKLDKDDAAGPNTPHFEHLFANGLIVPNAFVPPNASFFSMSTAITSPVSRGTLKLASSDPFATPLIDPGLLRDDNDMIVMREAIKHMLAFTRAPVWKGYIVAPSGGLENVHTEQELDDYIRGTAASFFHPVGTAAMSRRGARWGVVDPDLKVKKVDGLRVVDASVFPYIPTGHTSSAVYATAERAADIIKDSY